MCSKRFNSWVLFGRMAWDNQFSILSLVFEIKLLFDLGFCKRTKKMVKYPYYIKKWAKALKKKKVSFVFPQTIIEEVKKTKKNEKRMYIQGFRAKSANNFMSSWCYMSDSFLTFSNLAFFDILFYFTLTTKSEKTN